MSPWATHCMWYCKSFEQGSMMATSENLTKSICSLIFRHLESPEILECSNKEKEEYLGENQIYPFPSLLKSKHSTTAILDIWFTFHGAIWLNFPFAISQKHSPLQPSIPDQHPGHFTPTLATPEPAARSLPSLTSHCSNTTFN